MTAIKRLPIAVLVGICCGIATPAAAQRDSAVIGGAVRGETGMPLGGATVTARNLATGLRRTDTTAADGDYVIANLPVEGAYEVKAELRGFAPAVRGNVSLHANERVTIAFSLTVSAAESVTVSTAAEPLPDRERSTLRQTVDDQLIQALPLLGRNFVQLASLSAGFTGNADFPSPQGQMYWTNNVLVDGASHYSKWRSAPRAFYSGYGLESIKEVQILTSLFPAEFGEALGSVTSAITRSGTNEWHGSALLFIRNEALDAMPAFAAAKPPVRAQQYGFSLGGPLVKDRTHFWGSYEARRSRDRNIVVSPAAVDTQVPDNQDERLAFFRIDHQTARQLVTARYNGQFFRWHDEPGGLVLAGAGTKYRNDVHTILVTDGLQMGSRTLNELRLQFARYVDIRQDLQPTVFVSRAGYSVQGGMLGPLGFGANPEDTWEAADTLSQWKGSHALKVGGGLRYVRSHNTSLGYGRGAYFFAGPPDLFSTPFQFVQGIPQSASATVADPRSVSSWGFVQDDWTIRRGVTLNAGLRYDVESVFSVRGYDVPVDKDNVQPRVGATWVPDGGGRLAIHGGIGLYTQQQLLYPINRVQLEGIDGVAMIVLPVESPVVPVFPAVLPALPSGPFAPPRDVHRVGVNLLNPYSIQSTIGVEKALLGMVFAADYIHLLGRDLLSLVDVNAPASNPKPGQRTVAQADATRPIVPAAGTYRKIITLGNQGRSWYRALQLKTERSTVHVQAVVSYTLARAEDTDNYDLPEDSRNLAADKGRALADIRHNVAGGATWELPGALLRGWSLSGIGTFRSNRPYTITWGDDRNGTTQGDARPGDRNTGRTGAYRNIDVALARRFRTDSTVIEGRVEAFNVFNATNYDQYVGQLASPLFGRPVSAFPPRRLQLAAIVRF